MGGQEPLSGDDRSPAQLAGRSSNKGNDPRTGSISRKTPWRWRVTATALAIHDKRVLNSYGCKCNASMLSVFFRKKKQQMCSVGFQHSRSTCMELNASRVTTDGALVDARRLSLTVYPFAECPPKGDRNQVAYEMGPYSRPDRKPY